MFFSHRRAALPVTATELIKELDEREEPMKTSLTLQCTWHPEYSSYMIEVHPCCLAAAVGSGHAAPFRAP